MVSNLKYSIVLLTVTGFLVFSYLGLKIRRVYYRYALPNPATKPEAATKPDPKRWTDGFHGKNI